MISPKYECVACKQTVTTLNKKRFLQMHEKMQPYILVIIVSKLKSIHVNVKDG